MADDLDALLDRVDDAKLRDDLKHHIDRLRSRRTFGLVFESHRPERVRLTNHPVRRGALVALRDQSDDQTWVVEKISGDKAVLSSDDEETTTVSINDIVVVAEFGEPIYPGLKHLGSVHRGADKPAHVVINGENHHALEALRFTHAGKVDCIYIDPPYNTGARDWKYDNDYVDAEDGYRHSKWLAFMERRLKLAKELLNPENSVLIVTIDEKEYLRLGLLLEQTFVQGTVQMVTSVINPGGSTRSGTFSRTDEYLFFVFLGSAVVHQTSDDMLSKNGEASVPEVQWHSLVRHQASGLRSARPNLFYPIYISTADSSIEWVGDPLTASQKMVEAPERKGTSAVFPLYQDGTEGTWALSAEALRSAMKSGYVRSGTLDQKTGRCAVYYLKSGKRRQIEAGEIEVAGRDSKGALVVRYPKPPPRAPKTTWNKASHNARVGGSDMLRDLLKGRRFPFPKSLYAVEDALRFFVSDKPSAIVLDFFAGSGTTAHAVMRLNRQDGGRRQCISVTNNEVSAAEAARLRASGMRPGDPLWESSGIFEQITRPRVTAAITGRTPEGEPIKGDYKFTDEFPMAEGFEENVEFFELTYQDAGRIELHQAFEAIAPLLWLRAGGTGRVISDAREPDGQPRPYDFTDAYGVLFDADQWRAFVDELPYTVRVVFLVTDSQTTFATVAAELATGVEAVRLYRNLLSTFEIGRGV